MDCSPQEHLQLSAFSTPLSVEVLGHYFGNKNCVFAIEIIFRRGKQGMK